jgi:hypothetical protein
MKLYKVTAMKSRTSHGIRLILDDEEGGPKSCACVEIALPSRKVFPRVLAMALEDTARTLFAAFKEG